MLTREDVLRSPDYWFADAQNELYRQVVTFMEKEGLNQTELALRLGVTKGYISQILKGNFNYTLKKLIELSIAIGHVPSIQYKPISQVIEEDKKPRRSKKTHVPSERKRRLKRIAS